MKIFKKNQIIIYVIVLMLMTAGYLNFTSNTDNQSVETSMQIEASDDMELADIGDAVLVSNNEVVSENNTTENTAISNATSETDRNIVSNIEDNTNNNTDNDTVTTSSENSNNYFVKSKLERDTMYSQMIETYEKILNSSNSLETQKQTATQEIQKINETKNGIMICENLIKTKGFENCIVFVNGESISVIIGVSEIKQEEIAQVQNIVARELNAKVENIHISIK